MNSTGSVSAAPDKQIFGHFPFLSRDLLTRACALHQFLTAENVRKMYPENLPAGN
jgi:hypothetical protein